MDAASKKYEGGDDQLVFVFTWPYKKKAVIMLSFFLSAVISVLRPRLWDSTVKNMGEITA